MKAPGRPDAPNAHWPAGASLAGPYAKIGPWAKSTTREQLIAVRAEWKRAGKRVVFTNGCYDVLHPGHIRLLESARSLGDVLILALNTDASVQRLKGPTRPLISRGPARRARLRSRRRGRRHVLRRRHAARIDRRRASRLLDQGRRLGAFHRRPRRGGSRRRQGARAAPGARLFDHWNFRASARSRLHTKIRVEPLGLPRP